MRGTSKLRRLVAPLSAAAAIAGAAMVVGGATVLAWDQPPQVTADCSASTSTYTWTVNFNESGFSDYNIYWTADTTGTLPGSPTWTEYSPTTVSHPTSDSTEFTFTTPRSAGNHIWAEWVDDTGEGVFGPATADSSLCNTPGITTQLEPAASLSVGSEVHDTATLTGGQSPTGNVTFTIYTDSTCSSAVGTGSGQPFSAQGGTATVSGDATYSSAVVTANTAGTYYWQAVYSGDEYNNSVTSQCSAETLTVTKLTPSITTTLSTSSTPAEQSVSDTATLSGATSNAGGSVTFTIYTNSTCSTAASTSGAGKQVSAQGGSASVSGNGTYDSSSVTFYQTGTYYWQASYSGDGNNNSVTSACTSETLTVSNALPSVTTNLTSSAIGVGQTDSDSATLSGATPTASGTVTFTVYTDSSCDNAATTGAGKDISAQPGSDTVSGDGTYDSGTITFAQAGTYYWQAHYSGDGNNNSATSPCTSETVTVNKATPSITTDLSTSSINVGQMDGDSATLTGASVGATGTITFTVYTDNECTAPATSSGESKDISAQPGSDSVSGDGTYDSASITFDEAGTYYWQAAYSGDGNNDGAKSACTSETLTVNKLSPSVTTTLSTSSISAGQTAGDTATLSGATSGATGTVTFTVYTNDTCSTQATTGTGNQISAQPGSANVSGDGTYDSSTITFYRVGTYYWQAAYSGDGNDNGVKSACTSETLTVTKASPSITTNLKYSDIGADQTDSDSATLSGASSNAAGSVTFTIYTDNECSTPATTGSGNQINAQGGSALVSGDGTYGSATVTFYQGGTYYWQASYSGDGNNSSAKSACTSETLTVAKASPSITTQLEYSEIGVGTSDSDTATLSGTTAGAGGTVTFTIYTDDECTTPATTTGPEADINQQGGSASVDGSGTYDSSTVTFNQAATYYWQASYSGDLANNSATSTCTSEIATVTKATPSITTTLSTSSTPAGQSVSDTADLTGTTLVASGTVTFTIYTDDICSTPATTGTGNEISNQGGSVTVSGPGTYDSATVTFYDAGTYYWQASYSGDNNNTQVASPCTSETLTVTKDGPSLTTQLAASSLPADQSVSDTATLTGATAYAGGTVAFTIYTDDSCTTQATTGSGNEISNQGGSASVSGPGTYDSATVTFYDAGTYYWQAYFSGDANNNMATSPCTSETLTVNQLQPSITTTLSSSSSPADQSVSDSADLSGATTNAGGTVTFTVYTDDTCSSPATTGSGNEISNQGGYAKVSGTGTYYSATVTFYEAGTYYWQASYSGDSNNKDATSPCTSETLTVTQLQPSITTSLSTSSTPVDQTVSDSANLSGATPYAGGTVTFTVYTDDTCSTAATTGSGGEINVQGGSATVSGSGTYYSATVTFHDAGTYYWQASYSGDNNNQSAKSGCTSETLTVTQLQPAITTTLSTSWSPVDQTVSDSADLSGATPDAGGTVTFTVYTDNSCSSPATTGSGNEIGNQGGSASVSGSGTYYSATVTFYEAGTYYWQASYSGDSNNKSVKSGCTSETLTVTQLQPAITTTLSASSSPAGQTVSDSADLTGTTPDATGTLTFTIYTDDSCRSPATTGTGNEISNQGGTGAVSGPGTYYSATVTFYEAGTYYWQAFYSGDHNDHSAKSGCQSETLIVAKDGPSITTQLASSTLLVGETDHDTATLSGATSYAGGSVTFTVYSNDSCTIVATSGSGDQISNQGGSASVSGNGTYDSGTVTFNEAGTFYWQAAYSGDANNRGAVSACSSEPVTVASIPTPTAVPTPTPTGGVQGITTPGTGAGPTVNVTQWGLLLMLIGSAIFLLNLVMDRRNRGDPSEI